MRDDELISAGYPFKRANRYDNKEYFGYLSEDDKMQDVVSMFVEIVFGKNSNLQKLTMVV